MSAGRLIGCTKKAEVFAPALLGWHVNSPPSYLPPIPSVLTHLDDRRCGLNGSTQNWIEVCLREADQLRSFARKILYDVQRRRM
jgi:hypothetical protein